MSLYVHRNILHDNQEDQSSRWSSMSNSPPQVQLIIYIIYYALGVFCYFT